MKFPAYFSVGSYLAFVPERVGLGSNLMPRAKNDRSPLPEPTSVDGEIGGERRDLSAIKEPIHQLFVNWPSDPSGIVKFTQKYGPIDVKSLSRRSGELSFSFSFDSWRSMQLALQRLWDLNGRRDAKVVCGFHFLPAPDPPKPHPDFSIETLTPAIEVRSEVQWIYRRDVLGAEVCASSLYRHMYFLIMFEKLGSLRVCKNPGCVTPRFRALRKDKIYCCTDCAELIAKRRWWEENGNEWRRNRQKVKSKSKRGTR
jgi:hypothetical protein